MAEFKAILGSLERRKVGMLRGVARWSPRELVYRSAPAAWCALDVLDHVARTELNISLVVRAGMRSPEKVRARDAVMGLVVLAVMYAPTRVKTPAGADSVLPQTPESLEAAVGSWESAREHLLETVRRVKAGEVRGAVFRHPVGGWMSPQRTLRFLDSHLAHHAYQLRRIRKEMQGKIA